MILRNLIPFRVCEIVENESFSTKFYSIPEFIEEINRYRSLLQERQVSGLVAVDIPRSARMVAAVFALVESHTPFAFISPRTSPRSLGASHVLTDSGLHPLATNKDHVSIPSSSCEICYCIRTSGSTGVPKCVSVPPTAIWPNIVDFRDRFNITNEDTILFSTSVLFDPSVVELFLCMLTGASMIVVPDSVRSSPSRLAQVIRSYQPTFVQMTPAVFRLLDLQEEVVMNSVRILLLGGEKFPLESVLMKRRKHFTNARIFDVYGITEVSCWAAVFEVDESCSEVFLGEPILDTRLEIDSEGHLFIGGGRQCWIDGVLSGELTSTGDLVERTVEGQLRIIGRTDDLVKINGVRCHLVSMSQKLCQLHPCIEFARFLLWKDAFLVLFVKSSVPVEDGLVSRVCPNLLRPSAVIHVDEIPVNRNGKIDSRRLVRMLEMSSLRREKEFWRILSQFHIFKDDVDATFVERGIKSLDAAEIALVLGNANAMQEILSSKTTVADIVEKYLKNDFCGELGEPTPNVSTAWLSKAKQPVVRWAVDTKKCIDGSPLIFKENEEEFILVASHSGVVVCFVHSSMHLRWKVKIEEARFEASAALSGDCAVVGSYDGNLYFISLKTGEIVSVVNVGDSIKAQAAVDSDGDIYISSYNRKLFKFTSKGSVSWEEEVAAGSPSLACLCQKSSLAVVTTIKGTIEAMHMSDGTPRWKFSASAPIFSPAVLDEEDLLVSCVDGSILVIDSLRGVQKLSIRLDEPVFSAVFRHNDKFLVASQKGTIFLLNPENLNVQRRISFLKCSFVRSPFALGRKLAITSTDGRLVIMNPRDVVGDRRVEATEIRLGSREVFGQPVATADGCLVVGCRDDWIRCFVLEDSLLTR